MSKASEIPVDENLMLLLTPISLVLMGSITELFLHEDVRTQLEGWIRNGTAENMSPVRGDVVFLFFVTFS